ncbi:hypothetical protein A4A49_62052, partial [Nicotiana attenuata]
MKDYKVKTARRHQVLARQSWKSLLQLSPSPACNNVIWYMSHSLTKDEIWSLELQACFSPSHKAECTIFPLACAKWGMARRLSSLRNTLYVFPSSCKRMYQVAFVLSENLKIRKDFGSPRAKQDDALQI